jgi:hypothetical protein
VPGISVEYSEDFTVEIRAYLDLPAGLHRFGVVTDDGYKISAGATPADKTPLLAFHNGGPANETFDFVVPVAGLYGFRMVWYERGGNAFAEWFSVDLATGTRTLINDPDSPNAVKAYQDVVPAPAVKLQSSAVVTGFFADTAATIDTVAKKVTVPASGAAHFYRLSSATALRITSITLAGGNVVITYE